MRGLNSTFKDCVYGKIVRTQRKNNHGKCEHEKFHKHGSRSVSTNIVMFCFYFTYLGTAEAAVTFLFAAAIDTGLLGTSSFLIESFSVLTGRLVAMNDDDKRVQL
jgi:hypothetical protein